MRSAREAREDGRAEEAKKRYETFIAAYQSDPLLPIAQLELGKILFAEGDLEGARQLFEEVEKHSDPAISERGRLYSGLWAHAAGDHHKALTHLGPLVDRVVDPEERSLVLWTVAEASVAGGDRVGAVLAWDRFLEAGAPVERLELAKERMLIVVEKEATAEEVGRLYQSLPRGGAAWPHVAGRSVRIAYDEGRMEAVKAVVAAMRDQRLEIGAEVHAMLLRAERSAEADPYVIGAILPLTGRSREVGQLALRGMMLGVDGEGIDPGGANRFRVVFRDSAGDPERAARAVDDLVSLHRAVAIVGPIESSVVEAVAKRADEVGVPLLTLSPGTAGSLRGSMVFSLFATLDAELAQLMRAAKERGARRLLIVRANHAYGAALEAAARRQLGSAGLDLADVVSYEADSRSLRQIMADIAKQRFDAILIADSSRQVAVLAPALAAVGIWSTERGGSAPSGGRAATLLLPSAAFEPSLLRSSSRYLQGALVSRPYDATASLGAARKLAQLYGARYGGVPDIFAAHAYDAVRMLQSVVKSGAQSRPDVALRLPSATIPDYAGPSMGLTDHSPRQATRLFEIHSGLLVPYASRP